MSFNSSQQKFTYTFIFAYVDNHANIFKLLFAKNKIKKRDERKEKEGINSLEVYNQFIISSNRERFAKYHFFFIGLPDIVNLLLSLPNY